MVKIRQSSKVKKVGILTFYDVINYGAFLQAYSLYKVLETKFKVKVEIINYKSARRWFLENLMLYHKIYNVEYFKNYITKIHKFREAQALFKKSKKIFLKNQIAGFKYDYIIFGSDEIWNYKNPLAGFDMLYFGYYTNSTKIAYAPSFGPIDKKTTLSPEIVKSLSTFKDISVRDENSQEIIARNLGLRVPLVLDPTLLINDMMKPIRPKDKDFILVYITKISEQYINSIKKFALSQKKKLIAVGYDCQWCDKSYINVGLEEWLGFYESADFVVTSTFHGTIYAVKYKKNFVSIMNEYINNKLSTFMKCFKLEDRILTEPEDLEKILSKKPNYQKISEAISVKRRESLDFIKKSLEL